MLVKTSKLSGKALDWAVAKCEGITYIGGEKTKLWYPTLFNPSRSWLSAGPIIEREGIAIRKEKDVVGGWYAQCGARSSDVFASCFGWDGGGETPLIAAMRCYVASKLDDEVEVPDELFN